MLFLNKLEQNDNKFLKVLIETLEGQVHRQRQWRLKLSILLCLFIHPDIVFILRIQFWRMGNRLNELYHNVFVKADLYPVITVHIQIEY